jgi:hypothetical protein
MIPRANLEAHNDWVRRPTSWFLWWGLPLAVGFATNFLTLPLRASAFVWAGALAWMGTGCVLNARRCHRLHCYISGPVFALGAIAAGAVGLDVVATGPHALTNIVSATLGLALLSFVPEMIWRKYA